MGSSFNVNSPKQLSEILFTKLAIPTKGVKKTKLGFSTDSSVLEKLEAVHPIAPLLLNYRMLHKLKTTYTDSLAKNISQATERVHSRFNQTGTGTGRLSSSDPNLQNIPIQSQAGRRIREAFIADPGHMLISADYSQIELRLLAHLSGDHNLIDAFNRGIDIHAQTAAEVLGIGAGEKISSEARRVGKTINFGIVYGMGPYRLARDLKISNASANEYISNYFRRYPRVREYFDSLELAAKKEGEVRTILGRRRVLSSIDTTGRDDGFTVRAGLNAPIQGSAADVIKLAMVQIDSVAPKTTKLLLQIHDELVLEVVYENDDQIRAVGDQVREVMENVMSLSVPLKVDVGFGSTWGAAQH